QLQDDVDVALDRLARGRDTLDHAVHQRVLRHVAKTVRNRVELDRRKTLLSRRARKRSDFLRGLSAHQQMQPHSIAVLATQQLPDWRLQQLSLDVPQRDVDGADRAAQDRAAEGAHAVQVLPVALDLPRILTDQVFLKRLYHGMYGRRVRPAR